MADTPKNPDTPVTFTERQAESKVIPPPNPNIRYPEVASIPPGQKSVVVIPKTDEFPNRENTDNQESQPVKEQVVRIDAVDGEPTP